jgi:hypothetical protein
MATGRIGSTPVLRVRWSLAPAGGTTALSGLDDNSVALVYDAGYEAVYRNGVLLSRGNDYTATDGTTVTLTEATITGDIIEIFANDLVPLTDAISKGQYNAKGALLSATAASTPGVLAVGTNAQVLTADSTEATGLKWATPAAGSLTSIASGSLSGASVVLGSIPATYTDLRLDILDYYASSNAFLELIITGITSNYFGYYLGNEGGSPFGPSTVSTSKVAFKGSTANADNNNRAIYYFKNYADTTSRKLISAQDVAIVGGAALALTNAEYTNSSTAAISSLTIAPSAGTFSGGTYVLYGVK